MKNKISTSKTLKYMLAVLTAVLVLLAFSAFAENDITFSYTLKNGKATITGYSGSSSEIVIPKEIDGYPVEAVASLFLRNNTKAENVVLPDADITLKTNSFQFLLSDDTLTVPASVTKFEDGAFDSWLTRGTIYVTESSPMHEYAMAHRYLRFCYTENIYSYTVSGTNCTLTGYHGPKIARLPSTIDGYTLTAIGKGAFEDSIVEQVYIPNTVKTIASGAFKNMRTTYLRVMVPSSVTSISAASIPFEQYWYYGEEEWDYFDMDIKICVTHGSKAYNYFNDDYYSNTNIWDGSDFLFAEDWSQGVKGYSLDGYLGTADELVLPTTFNNQPVVSVAFNSFQGIRHFKKITIPEGYLYLSEYSLSHIDDLYLPRSLREICDCAFDYIGTIHVYSNSYAHQRLSEMGMDYELIDLEAYSFTESASAITITGFKPAEGQTEIQIPTKMKGKPVTAIGANAFTGTNLTRIFVPNTVASIGDGAFSGVRTDGGKTSIEIMHSKTSFGKNVFDANSLIYVVMDSDAHRYAETNGYKFYIYEGTLDNFSFRLNVEDNSYTITGYRGSGSHIDYPDNILGLPVTSISGSYNNGIKSVVIPEGVTTISGMGNFPNLESISLPNTLTTIEEYTFDGAAMLGVIELPASVKYIGDYACLGLHTVFCYSMDVTCGDWCFDGAVYGYSGSTLKKFVNKTDGTFYALESSKFTADKNFVYSVSSGKVTIKKYTGNGKYVTVPSEIDGYPVTAIGARAFADLLVFDVTLPDTIKSIGNEAFNADLVQWEKYPLIVRIPPSVTSFGSNIFSTYLRKAYILTDMYNMSNPVYKRYWRSNSDPLEGVELAEVKEGSFWYHLDYEGDEETIITAGIQGYLGYESDITLPTEVNTFEEGKVKPTHLGYFESLFPLNSITIPEGYTTISRLFSEYTSVKHIYLPRSLNEIEFGAPPTGGVTYHVPANSYAYKYFSGNGSYKYEIIDYASIFEHKVVNNEITITKVNCDDDIIYIPSKLNGKYVRTIGSYALEGCSSRAVYLPDSITSYSDNALCNSAVNGDIVFCLNRTNSTFGKDVFDENALVYLPSGNTAAKTYLDENNIRYNYKSETADGFKYVFNFDDMSYTIENYVGTETDIVVPNSFRGFPVNTFFGISDNPYVRRMNISGGIDRMDASLAEECPELVEIILPEDMTGRFASGIYGCPRLEHLVIPEGITEIDAYLGVTNLIVLSRKAIFINTYTVPEYATIYGYAGSPAESYAKFHACVPFKNINTLDSLKTPLALFLFPMTIEAEVATEMDMLVYPENDYASIWTSSDESIVTVENGIITGISDGTAEISVTIGNESAEATVTVLTPLKDFFLAEENVDMVVGSTAMLGVAERVPAAAPTAITYSISDENVISIDENGNVTALATGEATLTATSANGIVKTCTVSVFNPVTALSLSHSTLEIPAFESAQLTATVTCGEDIFENRMVTFSSTNSEVAIVNKHGLVTLVGNGEADITVTAIGNSSLAGSCKIVVTGYEYAEGIEISGENIVDAGKTISLTAAVLPETASDKRVKWFSSDGNIAKVENGVVSGISGGIVTITAQHADGVSRDYSVTVRPMATAVQLNRESLILAARDSFDSYRLSFSEYPAGAVKETAASWTSSDKSVATVRANGLVTVHKAGTATITLETKNGLKADIVVTASENPAVFDIPSSVTAIAEDSFRNLASIEFIYVPDGVTSIGKDAFAGCTKLMFIRLPDSVSSIADSAFDGCEKLCIICPDDSAAARFAERNNIEHME